MDNLPNQMQNETKKTTVAMIRQSVIELRKHGLDIESLRMKSPRKLIKPMKAIKTICLIAKLILTTNYFGNTLRHCIRIRLE